MESLFRRFVRLFAVLFVLYHLIYISDVLLYLFNIALPIHPHLGVHLGGLLFLTFLLVPAGKAKPRSIPPWYDIILALICLVPIIYYILFSTTRVIGRFLDPWNIWLGWLLLALLLEAARRTVGWTLSAIMALFVFYALFTNVFPGFLHGVGHSYRRVGEFMFSSPSAIFGVSLETSSRIIIVFLLFAALLSVTGAGTHFTNLALSLVGRVQGGAAKAAVVASGLFGMISGSPASNIATTGTFTIPLMKRTGYSATYAAAVEATAATGGIFTPPVMGAVAFVMAQFIEMPYADVMVRSFFPAFLYYFTLFLMAHFQAKKLKIGGIPEDEVPTFRQAGKQSVWLLMPFAALMFLMLGLNLSVEKACIGAIVCLLLLAAVRKDWKLVGPRQWIQASEVTARTLLTPGIACATAGIAIATVQITGLGGRLAHELVAFAGGNLFVLLVMTALASFVLGMGLIALACYVILAVLVAPVLVEFGVPVLPAHLFILYWGVLSFLTPPVCVAAFVAAALANSPPLKTGLVATRLAIAAYILPFVFVFRPSLLLIGSIPDIIQAMAAGLVAMFGVACAFEGYLFIKASWLQRGMFAGGTVLLLSPDWRMNVAGLAAMAGAALWNWGTSKVSVALSRD